MKKSRLITAGIVLLGAFISCICSIIEKVSFGTFVKRLALTVIIFIVIAFVIEIIIEWNFRPPEEEEENTEDTEEEGEEEASESEIENVDTSTEVEEQ